MEGAKKSDREEGKWAGEKAEFSRLIPAESMLKEKRKKIHFS